MSASQVRTIQRDFPQIYLACHVDHQSAKRSPHGLSVHQTRVLSHLEHSEPLGAGQLARHLGIAPSTLSATLTRLEKLGYLQREVGTDRRRRALRLTLRGRELLGPTSVLDGGRVAQLLAFLTPTERRVACDGLALLAGAATRLIAQREVVK